MRCLLPQIAFLSNVEIRYCVLGRGGAERSECPPRQNRIVYAGFAEIKAWYAHMVGG